MKSIITTSRRVLHHGRVAWLAMQSVGSVENPILILSSERSGSNLLVSAITNTEIHIFNEPLNPVKPIRPLIWPRNCSGALNYLDRIFKTAKSRHVGAKIQLGHLQYFNVSGDALAERFPKARYVVLYRQSLVDQYISLMTATHTKSWVQGVKPQRDLDGVRFCIDDFMRFAVGQRRLYRDLLRSQAIAASSLIISYEELVANTERFITNTVCKHLDILLPTVGRLTSRQERVGGSKRDDFRNAVQADAWATKLQTLRLDEL